MGGLALLSAQAGVIVSRIRGEILLIQATAKLNSQLVSWTVAKQVLALALNFGRVTLQDACR